ncbi:uncharacterized protein LOC115728063 [Rhodamnia argentea]|uniref:Uncharacterized protein LOC115728063 n=1 Tax=Rhodamnia argentea TaxID=178133 RepID=A0ABM3HEM1_9MYRT|nr:uncharacterized protein LOC115728063 [Rhodamnia argentea]XP_048135056.1 uncharacterized protein LOC115728063 [Rhodamnia argentea]
MAERERVHPDCVNAANPFHRCVEDCYIKIATSKAHKSKSFSGYNTGTDGYNQSPGRRTTRGSSFNKKPVDALKKATIRSAPVAGARSPPSKLTSPKTESESTNPESLSWPFSGEIHFEDFSFNKGQLGTSRFTTTSGNATPALGLSPDRPVKASSSSVTPITSSKLPKETESNQGHMPPEVVSSIPVNGGEEGTQHVGLHDHSLSSGVSHLDRPSEASCEEGEEVQSVALDSRVSVGKYYVKESVSSTLRAIFEKYGDIAESCRMESIAMRSYCLECVCLVVHDLRSSSTTQLTESKLQEMSAVLKDLESSRIKVDWLCQVLERLSKSEELIAQRDAIKVEKSKCDRVLEATKLKLEHHLEDLAKKERAVADAKARVAETEDRLRQIELDSSKLGESIASLQSHIESHRLSSLLDELV